MYATIFQITSGKSPPHAAIPCRLPWRLAQFISIMVRPHSSIAAAFPGYGSATPSAEFRSFGIKRPTICMGAHAKQRITLRAAAIHYAADPKKNRTPIVLMSIRLHTSALVTLVATGVGLLLCPRTVMAQKQCNFLCAPSVVIEQSMITNHLFSRPGVRALSTGAVHTLPSTTNLEIVVAASLKTLWPTVSLYGSVQWLSLIHISEPTRQAEISYAVF